MGFVDDGSQLLVGVLLGSRRTGVGHHPTRRADLDQLRTVLDLVADRFANLIHTVGDPLLDGQGHDVGGEGLEHRRIEMPAGRGDGVPGRDDTRTLDPAAVDGLLQGHIQQKSAGLNEQPEVPHGREPGTEGATGVGHRPQGSHRRVVLHRVERAAVIGAAQEEVHLHVHQSGHDRQFTEVDDDRIRRHRRRVDLPNVLVLDQEVARGHQLALHDIEHSGAA